MIARVWKGWASLANADYYEKLLRSEVLPGIHRIKGSRGSYLLRRDTDAGAEFSTITLWDSMDAIKEFAGEDYEKAVIHAEAARLLSHYDERSVHYRVLMEP